MATFKVLHTFKIPQDAAVVRLARGAVYLEGHEITGLSAAEARELLALAPEGTFEAVDAEAYTVETYQATHTQEINRTVDVGGELKKGKS